MNDNYPLVSIVIITWNRKEDILETLSRLENLSYSNYEIIVVDNNSTDGTKSAILNKYPHIKLIALDKNIGIAARNHAISKARGDFVVIVDSDSHLEVDALDKIVKYFKSDPDLSVICCRVINIKNNSIETDDFEHAMLPDDEKGGYLYYDFHGVGSAFRKSIFDKSGMFSEIFHVYLEENELSIRILECGGKIKYFSDIIAYHRRPHEGKSKKRAVFLQIRNHTYILFTYFGWKDIIIQSFIRYPQFFVDYVIRDRHFWPFLRGLLSAIDNLPVILKQRRVIGKKTRDYYMYFFWRLERYRLEKRLRRYVAKFRNIFKGIV